MALTPYMADHFFNTFNNHDFGLGLRPRDLMIPAYSQRYHPFGSLGPLMRSAFKNIDGMEKESHIGKDGFQVLLDVQHFSPNEISVKTVDNTIIVEAKHEERKDEHGLISRQFTRRYQLPDGFDTKDVISTISSDGILTIKAPPTNPAIEGESVRHVQIQQTGPAALNVNKAEAIAEPEKK